MIRLLAMGMFVAIALTVFYPMSLSAGALADGMERELSGVSDDAPQTSTQRTSSVSNELRKLNGRTALLKRQNDSLRVRIQVLEQNIQAIMQVLPQLKRTLGSAVQAKAAMDSSELAMVNQLSLLMNKISLLEDKAGYIDSTNFEILSQLVLLENRIVSLTGSFNDVMAARQPGGATRGRQLTDEEYRRRYIDALTTYQDGQIQEAITKFTELVNEPMRHELAGNAQYWLAECYYDIKNFKRAIMEFERVFQYAGTTKGDDAQLKIALCYWHAGNQERARSEFQRLLVEYPETEYGTVARQYLQ